MAGPPRSRDGAGTTEIMGRWKRPFGAGPEQAEGSVRLRGHEAPTSPSPASAAQTLLLGSGPHPNEASPSHSYGEGDDQGQVHGCSVPRGQRKALRGGLARPDGARGGRPGRDPEPRVRADLLATANGSGDGSGGLAERVWEIRGLQRSGGPRTDAHQRRAAEQPADGDSSSGGRPASGPSPCAFECDDHAADTRLHRGQTRGLAATEAGLASAAAGRFARRRRPSTLNQGPDQEFGSAMEVPCILTPAVVVTRLHVFAGSQRTASREV